MDQALQDRPEEYERARGKYIIDNETMKILPTHSVIMHPLPRVDEVDPQKAQILCVYQECSNQAYRLFLANLYHFGPFKAQQYTRFPKICAADNT